MLKVVTIVCLCLVSLSCKSRKDFEALEIQAMNSIGQPIRDASVSIGSEKVGETNSIGILRVTDNLARFRGQRVRVEFDGFKVYQEDLDPELSGELIIKALMLKQVSRNVTVVPDTSAEPERPAEPKEQIDVVVTPSEPASDAIAFLPLQISETVNLKGLADDQTYTVYLINKGSPIRDAACEMTFTDSRTLKTNTTDRGRCVFHYSRRYEGAEVLLNVIQKDLLLTSITFKLKNNGLFTAYPQPELGLEKKREFVGPPVELSGVLAKSELVQIGATSDALVLNGKDISAVEAVNYLAGISSEDLSFLPARHLLAEILASHLKKPAQAAREFGDVVKALRDVGGSEECIDRVRLNEGLAIILSGEKLLASDFDTARMHFIKAKLIFSEIYPHENSELQSFLDKGMLRLKKAQGDLPMDPKILRSEVQKWRKKTARL